MKNNHIYIDFHVLQTVPPSCVNRDDTGSPKTALYGGVTRARVSSQAWKHAMRLMFAEDFKPSQCGIRTKHIVTLVAERISKLNPSLINMAEKLAVEVLTGASLKIKSSDVGTDSLFFISDSQVQALAELVVYSPDSVKDKKACLEALMSKPSIDIALFGRMVAADPSINYDACAQIAHSISTHAVRTEYDYFTAVDDMASDNNAGAAHLGTIEFNSSTLYRYATINVTELQRLVGEDTEDAVRGFADAFIRSMPTGKLNSFANRTLPSDVYVTIRRDQPVNFSAAFETPVFARDGYVKASEKRLTEYAEEVYSSFVEAPEIAWCVGNGLCALAETITLKELLSNLVEWLKNNAGGIQA